MREIIPFTDEKTWLETRTKDITSTEISALFGISPYCTPFELWHRKKSQQYVKIDPNERMEAGLHYQDAIGAWFAKKNGWNVHRKTEYIRDTDLRIGASFDMEIEGEGLLEIKNVDGLVFKNDWTIKENGDIEEPLHIAIQVQHQLLVSGAPVCWLGVLVGGNTHYLIKRTPDIRVHEAIKQKVVEFWRTIDANIEPHPDFEADAEFIKSLYNFSEPGTVLNIADQADLTELAKEYKALGDAAKSAEERRDAIKAEVLTRIGTAEKAIGEGYTISAGMVGPADVAYRREGYRGFKLTWRKQK